MATPWRQWHGEAQELLQAVLEPRLRPAAAPSSASPAAMRTLETALAVDAVGACGTFFRLLGASAFAKKIGQPLLDVLSKVSFRAATTAVKTGRNIGSHVKKSTRRLQPIYRNTDNQECRSRRSSPLQLGVKIARRVDNRQTSAPRDYLPQHSTPHGTRVLMSIYWEVVPAH